MKTFDDLVWEICGNIHNEIRATMTFHNSYGIHIIRGQESDIDIDKPYQVLVLKYGEILDKNKDVRYNKLGVNRIMNELQEYL